MLGDDEAVEVLKAQEALWLVFDKVLGVAAEVEGIGVGDMMMSCWLVAEAGSVIGKGIRVVERITKY